MTSFSVKDILNLPDTTITSKSEPSSDRELDFRSRDGDNRSPSCGIVCNQEQEFEFSSKE